MREGEMTWRGAVRSSSRQPGNQLNAHVIGETGMYTAISKIFLPYLFSRDSHLTLLSFTLKLNQFSHLTFIHPWKEKKKSHSSLPWQLGDHCHHEWPGRSWLTICFRGNKWSLKATGEIQEKLAKMYKPHQMSSLYSDSETSLEVARRLASA